METMSISQFKARCLSVIEEVRRTGEPILITKRGTPVAEVIPPARAADGQRELGSMSGTARITGDLVEPTGESWDALSG